MKVMSYNHRIVITGIGVVSSIGIGKKDFWNNLLNGKSGISKISSFDTSAHFTHYGGEVKIFNPEDFIPFERIRFMSRSTQMAVASAKLAIEDAALTERELAESEVGVSFGATLGAVQTIEAIDDLLVNKDYGNIGKGLVSQLPAHETSSRIASEFQLRGPNMMFSTACAAGNYSICYGYDMIKLNRADIVLAGASDALSRIEFTGFNQLGAVSPEKCQPFDKYRKGMMPAEGSGVLVLESLKHALERKAQIYAEILGYGLSCDANHMTHPSVEGISECMRKAIRYSDIQIKDIAYISAHGTGTPANDRAECAAIREVFGPLYRKVPVSSIKSMIGHAMGAASALEAIACALVVKNNVIPPTINFETPDPECDIDCVPNEARKSVVHIALNNSYAFGGNNASMVLKKIYDMEEN